MKQNKNSVESFTRTKSATMGMSIWCCAPGLHDHDHSPPQGAYHGLQPPDIAAIAHLRRGNGVILWVWTHFLPACKEHKTITLRDHIIVGINRFKEQGDSHEKVSMGRYCHFETNKYLCRSSWRVTKLRKLTGVASGSISLPHPKYWVHSAC